MKKLFILFLVSLGIAACTTKPKTGNTGQTYSTGSDSVESISQNVCFQKLSGTTNQDTAFIQFIIEGEHVSGNFSNLPYEKDSRVGTIQATKNGELIKGVWIYMQEGINDTLAVEFKLSGDKLVQKNYSIDSKTGREVFSEGSVFNIEFNKVNCPE